MTKLYDGEIIDLLPEKIADDTEVQCISYAIRMETRRILDNADKTRTMAMIDSLDENILDVLAVELRTPYYLESMDIEKKREIIKNTLNWYKKAGTVSAVEELISVIFGEGEVVEWWDFVETEGEIIPGEFDIIADTDMMSPEEYMDYFNSIISRVKNTRSHLRSIMFWREALAKLVAATLPQSFPVDQIRNDINLEEAPTIPGAAAALAESFGTLTIYNNASTEATIKQHAAAGGHLECFQTATITQS